MPGTLEETAYLADRAEWLVSRRWLLLGLGGALAGLSRALGIVGSWWPLAIVVGALGLNVAFAAVPITGRTLPALRRVVVLQLLSDVVAVVAILHFSDGLENPFVSLLAFPTIIGAMLLTAPVAYGLAGAAYALHSVVVLGEHRGWLTHHPLRLGGVAGSDAPVESGWFVAGHLAALGALLFGVVTFVRGVVEHRRRAEARARDHERVALSRERLAHIGEISAGVAHAVRNPVHGLLNAVDLLGTRLGPDDTLDLMGDALRRIEVVTRRLLVLGRERSPVPMVADVDALVSDTLRYFSFPSGERKVRVVTEPGASGEAEVDPDRVAEALINLVDNAVDASPDGAEVAVRTSGSAEDVVISVSDRGHGMTDEVRARVFQPFFTTKPVGHGTGLGLSITRRIVEEHGGSIEVTSLPGRGTTVNIRMPRRFRGGEEAP